jgi:hypothetical protein
MLKWFALRSFNIIFLSFLFQCSNATESGDCHPPVNSHQPQYIIAYGSLIETVSKNTTSRENGENQPVWIEHYQRGWFSKGISIGFSTTYLGVIKDKNVGFNGAIFRVLNNRAFKDFDAREKYYCRVLVPIHAIHLLNAKKLHAGQYWIYEMKPEFLSPPSSNYPIVQSYVDIFLSGCLQMEEKFHLKNFAARCVQTTRDWSVHWVNDRIYPRRPMVYQAKALAIDALLQQQIPTFFNQVQLATNN